MKRSGRWSVPAKRIINRKEPSPVGLSPHNLESPSARLGHAAVRGRRSGLPVAVQDRHAVSLNDLHNANVDDRRDDGQPSERATNLRMSGYHGAITPDEARRRLIQPDQIVEMA
jgi:hypothetical protein